jgi:tetratricopeptide (TPR) repeat protein
VQRTWSSTTVLSIGRSLVHAHYAAGHLTKAIELCDTICYNLRRSHGWLDADTVAMSKLLAELYTATHRHREAMAVHEEILREIDEDGDNEKAGLYANGLLELLKRAYQRLGGWDKNEKTYRELFAQLKRFGLSVQPIEHWSPKGADSMGVYVTPKEWKLEVGKEGVKKRDLTKDAVRRSCGYAYLAGKGERESPFKKTEENQRV